MDIPTNLTKIEAGEYSTGVTARGKAGPDAPHGTRQGITDFTQWFSGDAKMGGQYFGYDGPCPPWNDSIVHHYHFTLYAIDIARCEVEGTFDRRDGQEGNRRTYPELDPHHRNLQPEPESLTGRRLADDREAEIRLVPRLPLLTVTAFEIGIGSLRRFDCGDFGDSIPRRHNLPTQGVGSLVHRPASEASPRTGKGVNWVSLRFDLEIKLRFNDSVIPAGIAGIQCQGWQRNTKDKHLLLDSRLRGNDASA
uniref:Phosphatidylethanolamine-binding protein n=1 Tax=Candidatus Kentrum sp. LFY TaxID=2126342 RepID=A0A450WVH3_9GAMM|nr:MAG: Phosphatidylethanolamine-binding protein [Candidatus Kentron sp. LFY]